MEVLEYLSALSKKLFFSSGFVTELIEIKRLDSTSSASRTKVLRFVKRTGLDSNAAESIKVVKIILTLEQIKSLYELAQEEGQPSYIIEVGAICDGNEIVYEGLIAYSGSEEYGVLQLE